MGRRKPSDRKSRNEKHAAGRKHDPYAALRVRDFRRYMVGNFLSILGLQMQSAAVARELYDRTGEPFALAMIGLVQVLPVLGLALVAGHAADRFNRRSIIMTAVLLISVSAMGMAVVSFNQAPVPLAYGCLFLAGLARAFQQPAKASFLPHLVPRKIFPNAVTWSMAAFQMASVLGPAAAGIVLGTTKTPALVYLCNAGFALCFIGVLTQIRYRRRPAQPQPFTKENLSAGFRFVWKNKVILAATALDTFGVLFGAAIALLPIYAKDVLKVGDVGYGLMMSAPAAGAVCMSFVMSHRPPMKHAGRSLLLAVTGFGVATIVFGLSTWFPLSLAMLFLTGVLDNVSVVVRHSLIQLLTPDEMRGRVSAVNGMFISVSNEVGDIESGSVAQAFGPVFSAVSGGVGTLAVVGLVAWRFPQLRRYGRLDGSEAAEMLNPIAASETVVKLEDDETAEMPR
jgi:MFS family permease